MLRNLARAAAAATMLTTLAAAAEASGRVIVFGDSLSDNGNLSATTGNPPGPPYFRGSNGFTRFSNGPVWVEQLFGNFNSPVQGTGVNGNVDLAFGGALAGTGPNANGPIPNVQQQIGIYLGSGGRIGANDLVVVWAGANDIFQTTATTAAGFVTAGVTAATSEVGNVQSLISLGAQRLLVPNLPDFGQLPAYNTSAATSAAGTLSSSIFFAVASKLVTLNDRIWPALIGSGPEEAPPPLFQRAVRSAVMEDKSTGAAFGAVSAEPPERIQVAVTPSSTCTLARVLLTSTTRPVTISPTLCSAMYSSALDSGIGSSCFIPRRTRRRSSSRPSTCARTT